MKTVILNLTQHEATPEQVEAGVVDLSGSDRQNLKSLLTFDELPDPSRVIEAVSLIVRLAEFVIIDYLDNNKEDFEHFRFCAMIGGAPWMMSLLERRLREAGIRPVYAFSKRQVVEEMQADGTVKKSMIFKHEGFLEAFDY